MVSRSAARDQGPYLMNVVDKYLLETSSYSALDVMLADIAVRIQLTPTDYQNAIDRFEAINEWLDRADSPLYGHIDVVYPQGGFMIGATTARHATDAEFDIDLMAQINWPSNVDPEAALATTHAAIKSVPGSRYYDKCDRKSRCSTVQYADMHLDVTPAVRVQGRDERVSVIFHSKGPDRRRLLANPFGFGQWFLLRTPADEVFGKYYERRSLDFNRTLLEVMSKADAEPVPAQAPVYRKSRAVIALQLIKRWRNLAYDRRFPNLRLPPSVLLAYYVGLNAGRTRTLADELIYQVECIIAALDAAERASTTIYVENPMCREDVFTDRWPGNLSDQHIFLLELRTFVGKLYVLREGRPLAEMQRILEELFGEKPAREAVRKYTGQHIDDNKLGKSVHVLATGSIPALGSSAIPANAKPTPKSSPWGE
jgi:hypothetical protein